MYRPFYRQNSVIIGRLSIKRSSSETNNRRAFTHQSVLEGLFCPSCALMYLNTLYPSTPQLTWPMPSEPWHDPVFIFYCHLTKYLPNRIIPVLGFHSLVLNWFALYCYTKQYWISPKLINSSHKRLITKEIILLT